MVVGDPVDLTRFAAARWTAALNEATDVVMDAITALLDGLRGEKPPASAGTPRRTTSSRAASERDVTA